MILTLVVMQVHYAQIMDICMRITNNKIINIYLQELSDLHLVSLK